MENKNPYKNSPEIPSNMQRFGGTAHTETFGDNFEDILPDISLYGRGIYFSSNERFFMRLWLLISNPFRYLFTGKTRL